MSRKYRFIFRKFFLMLLVVFTTFVAVGFAEFGFPIEVDTYKSLLNETHKVSSLWTPFLILFGMVGFIYLIFQKRRRSAFTSINVKKIRKTGNVGTSSMRI